MECPLCKVKMEARVVLTGGCGVFGHPDGEPCYCDSPDVHVEFECPNRARQFWVSSGENVGKFIRNKHVCKQENLKVGELSDQFSMARWFTEHYVPSPDTKIF